MSVIFLTVVYFFIQSFLILTTNIQVPPEIYVFSWLVHKGLLPYKDFFDHHGFFLYYLFSPISADLTFYSYKIIYFILQTVNLGLFLFTLRKISSKGGYIVIGFLFVLLNYFISENFLWYEIAITTLFLLSYVCVTWPMHTFKHILLGIIALCASFIKPPAGLLIVSIAIATRKPVSVLVFILGWELLFFFYMLNNGLDRLLLGLFSFNSYLLLHYQRLVRTDLSYYFLIGILLILYALYWGLKKKIYRSDPFLIATFFISPVFLLSNVVKPHIFPFVTFALLVLGSALRVMKGNSKVIFVSLLLLYVLLIARKTSHLYQTLRHLPQKEEFIDVKEIYPLLDQLPISNKKLYISSYHLIEYLHYDVLPPTYIPMNFPLLDVFYPNFEETILRDLEENNITVAVLKKEDGNHYYPRVEKFLQEKLQHRQHYKKFTLYY